MAAKRLDNLLQRVTHVTRLVADHGEPEDRELAIILGFDLRHRYVESLPQPILDAANHLALVLERPRLAEQQANSERADCHSSTDSHAARNRDTGPTHSSPLILMPHSKPSRTSRTSSLTRLSESRPTVRSAGG